MNTGQMLLTIGALLLLSAVMLRVNSNNFSTETVRDEAKFGVIATSIATSIIEQAKGLAFDANTDTNSVNSISELTTVFNLGPDAGENSTDIKTFNDLMILMVIPEWIQLCNPQFSNYPVVSIM